MIARTGPKGVKSTVQIAFQILSDHPTWYVFPIAPGAKMPPCFKNELELASNNPRQIEKWANKYKDCNWGIALKKSKLIVMDVDQKAGKVGAGTLFDLEMQHGDLPTTYEVRSPSGGRHLYFNETATVKHRMAVNGFGQDIDSTNYVVAPGCVLSTANGGGAYKLTVNAPITDAPAWFAEYLDKPEAERVQQIPEVELDTDAVIESVDYYLTNDAPLAIQGRNGDATTLQVFGKLKDMGASLELAIERAAELWNDRCEPPWEIGDGPDTLNAKARNAYTYLKENAPGSDTAEAEFGAAPLDDNAINAAIVADMTWRANTKAKSSPAKSQRKRGIGDNSGELAMIRLDTVTARNVDFIWPGRLAKGKHTAYAGEGGIGKSQVTIDMVARITNGSAWPDVKQIREQGWPKALERAPRGHCVILSAEDDTADTIKPRLIAAGGNPAFVHVLDAVKTGDGERKFSLQDDLAKLKAFCIKLEKETGVPVVLIVIDPASSYMGGAIDASKNTAVRSVLDPITKLAQDLQCAVVSITHFRKGTSAKAVDKVMDSVAFVNAPRCALGSYLDPSDVGDFNNEGGDVRRYVFVPMKTNLPGARPAGLAYRIEEVIGGPGLIDARDGSPIKTSKIVWMGRTDLTADEISRIENDRGTPKLNEAMRFTREALPEDVPVPVAEVTEAAEAAGIMPATFKRARQRLRVKALAPEMPGGPRSWVRPSGARTGIELDPVEAAEVE
jgi:putative DNA primase/helicase